MIEIDNVTKRYGSTVAVNGLSFEVRAGEVTGFLGPNGAGKSTTMRMMVGLDTPTSGAVTIDGTRYQDLRFPLRHVGALLEARALHPGRSARNHLLAPAQSNGLGKRRVDDAIDLVGLTDVADRKAGLGAAHPLAQRLVIDVQLLGDRLDRLPVRRILVLMLKQHPHRPLTHLVRIPTRTRLPL